MSPRAALAGFALLSATALTACGGENSVSSEAEAAASETDVKIANYVPRARDMVIGDPDAPVTVVEYASVTCPHCATFHETTFPELKEKYVDTGQVKFVFREFPTPPAPLAVAGFLLARCAADNGGDQDLYFTMLDTLFRTQRSWMNENARAELLRISNAVGLNEQEFQTCVEDEAAIDALRDDIEYAANTYEITGTPAFVINEEMVRAFTLEQFDEALAPYLPAGAAGDDSALSQE